MSLTSKRSRAEKGQARPPLRTALLLPLAESFPSTSAERLRTFCSPPTELLRSRSRKRRAGYSRLADGPAPGHQARRLTRQCPPGQIDPHPWQKVRRCSCVFAGWKRARLREGSRGVREAEARQGVHSLRGWL